MTNSASTIMHYQELNTLKVEWLYADGRPDDIITIRITNCGSILCEPKCLRELSAALNTFLAQGVAKELAEVGE